MINFLKRFFNFNQPYIPRDPNWEKKARSEGWVEPEYWYNDALKQGWRPGPNAKGWFISSGGMPKRVPPMPPKE